MRREKNDERLFRSPGEIVHSSTRTLAHDRINEPDSNPSLATFLAEQRYAKGEQAVTRESRG